MHPQTEAIKLGAGDAIIADQPAGRCERNDDAYKGDRENRDPAISSQRAALQVFPTNRQNSNMKVMEFDNVAVDCAAPLIKLRLIELPRARATLAVLNLSNFANQPATSCSLKSCKNEWHAEGCE